MSGRVTLAGVAKATGKSAQTVSKILNGGQSTTNVSAATKALVLEAAARLGYRPNRLARTLRQGRMGSLGMLVSDSPMRSYLPVEFVLAAVAEAERLGFDIKLEHYADEELLGDEALPRVFREIMVDGLLVNYFDDSEATATLCSRMREHRVPAIWLNRDMPEDSVYFDDYGAGREMAAMMLESGLRQLAYVDLMGKMDAHYSRRQRPHGFVDRVREAGLEPELLLDAVPARSQPDFLRQWLRQRPGLEAVVKYGGDDMPPVFDAAVSLGRRVGEDFHVGFFGSDDSLPTYPRFVVVQDSRRFGVEAVQMLREKLDRPDRPLPSRVVKFLRGTPPVNLRKTNEFVLEMAK